MSRKSAHGALVATSAASAVISLCVLATLAGSGAVRVPGDEAVAIAHSTPARPSVETAAYRAAMVGSHQGVWFHLNAESATLDTSAASSNVFGDPPASGSPAEPAATPPAPAKPPAKPAVPAQPKPAQQQTSSSVMAAISDNPRDIAQAMASSRGWAGNQWLCLDKLWMHESRYETTVRNRYSGAYGIPQALPASKMATAGADWRTNPVTQIKWGLEYISGRYDTPCGAWSYWLRHNSY